MYRHTPAKDADRFPPWALGAYDPISFPKFELAKIDKKTKKPQAEGKAYVLQDGTVEMLIKVDNIYDDRVYCTVIAKSEKIPGQRKNKWVPVSEFTITRTVYLTRPNPKVRGIEVMPGEEGYEELMAEMPKWEKPKFWYPTYLLETGGGKTRRARHVSRTRRSKRSQKR